MAHTQDCVKQDLRKLEEKDKKMRVVKKCEVTKTVRAKKWSPRQRHHLSDERSVGLKYEEEDRI